MLPTFRDAKISLANAHALAGFEDQPVLPVQQRSHPGVMKVLMPGNA
jgi:hypothetical protein